jgi:hypothetical protein
MLLFAIPTVAGFPLAVVGGDALALPQPARATATSGKAARLARKVMDSSRVMLAPCWE